MLFELEKVYNFFTVIPPLSQKKKILTFFVTKKLLEKVY